MIPTRYLVHNHTSEQLVIVAYEDQVAEEDKLTVEGEKEDEEVIQVRLAAKIDEIREKITTYLQSRPQQKLLQAKQQQAEKQAQQVAQQSAQQLAAQPAQPVEQPIAPPPTPPILYAWKTAQGYQAAIHTCLDKISQGESYEICLTAQFSGPLTVADAQNYLAVYQRLRQINPAPHAAYLRLAKDSAICCTSPEQYLTLDPDTRKMTSKPIKGTLRRNLADPEQDRERARQLYQDEKSQAENLMIVDLVRNDLGKVSEVGSVAVEKLMDIETYASVHQMVSTITGTLAKKLDSIDAILATFPGGSMTGAPKLRTMQIIQDELEPRPRGIYSGAIGVLGSNGLVDLNIVIRKALLQGEKMTIGAGGAIVALSDVQEEMDEVLLKASAVAKSLGYQASFPV